MNNRSHLKRYISKLFLIYVSCLCGTLFISPVSLYSQKIETTIDIGPENGNGFPIGLAVNRETNVIYVSSL